MSNERYIRIFYYLCNALGDNAGARDFTNIFINPVSPAVRNTPSRCISAISAHTARISAYSGNIPGSTGASHILKNSFS